MDLKAFDEIHELLEKALKTEPGIKKIILTDRAGVTIAHASQSLEYLVEIDELGAIASHSFIANQNLGQELELNGLNFMTLEFDEGKVRIAAIGKGILCFYTDLDVCIIKLLLRSLEDELKELIEKYLKDPLIDAFKLNELLSKSFTEIE